MKKRLGALLGQALTEEGKYDDAVVAFGRVKGAGPVTPRIARLWVDYAKIKKSWLMLTRHRAITLTPYNGQTPLQ